MVEKPYLATVRPRDVAGDAQAQPGPAGFPAARRFESKERFEHRLQRAVRDSGAVVANPKREARGAFRNPDLRALAIQRRVVDQIGYAALEELFRWYGWPRKADSIGSLARTINAALPDAVVEVV